MRLLLDTHVVLWQISEPDRLGRRAEAMMSGVEARFVSAVSFIEVGIKTAIGKLHGLDDFRSFVPEERVLPVAAEHGLALARLPLHHRDPWDRLLIAQAQAEGLTIVTADAAFAAYDVPVIDATA